MSRVEMPVPLCATAAPLCAAATASDRDDHQAPWLLWDWMLGEDATYQQQLWAEYSAGYKRAMYGMHIWPTIGSWVTDFGKGVANPTDDTTVV